MVVTVRTLQALSLGPCHVQKFAFLRQFIRIKNVLTGDQLSSLNEAG